MQRRRLRARGVSLLRWMLTCATGAIALGALLAVHVFPSSGVPSISGALKLREQQNGIGRRGRWRWSGELRWTQEFAPPQLSKLSSSAKKLNSEATVLELSKLWKSPSNRDFAPCVAPISNYLPPSESRGYLVVYTNGGLNQMRAGISDMVAVARLINATLVIPKLDKRSFWQDSSNFSDVFDEDHFIQSLSNDAKIVKKVPKELAPTTKVRIHFRSWSGVAYYQDEIYRLWDEYKVIRAAKADSRLANNNLPPDIQKLRCRAFYGALHFAPK
uniref:O-fucosyltransferase family protein n=1 Tax=Ananas comosus var. bracteatus TaxID=296719 RepID=A0A6V7Q4V0_ANACO|nr:unnamed protein product [Ananas comosus var. bracteatus]